jgi:hypothetical protein
VKWHTSSYGSLGEPQGWDAYREVEHIAGIPGPIQGEAQRIGLTSDTASEGRTAGREERTRLDKEDLQALEQAEYYGGADPVPAATSATDGFLKRLWHRLRRSG